MVENENKTLIDKIKDEILLNGGQTTNEIAGKFLGVKNASPLNQKIVEKIFKNYQEFYFDDEKWCIKEFSANWEKAEFSAENFGKEPQTFGVFGFYDENKKIIFVGNATNVREKLLSFCEYGDNICEDIKKLRKSAVSYIVSTCTDEKTALEIERKLIAKHKPILNEKSL
ncbi:MAG: GIY-YIG nuclease family protein [Chitinispirillales bacterium]|jgi:hypothetical protein|nr:GIY-YIG nuclease family protein [Chitinispirillales bacterium]